MLVVQSIADLPYVSHLKLPIHWRDDQSGKVSGAIWAYICHCAEPQKEPAPGQEQLRMVAEYGKYYIGAPCWDHSEFFVEELARLRGRIAEVVDLAALRSWIHDCLKIAVDPL